MAYTSKSLWLYPISRKGSHIRYLQEQLYHANNVGLPAGAAVVPNFGPFDIDTRANIWGIGAVLYNCMTGEPFQRIIPPSGATGAVNRLNQDAFMTTTTSHPNVWGAQSGPFISFGHGLFGAPYNYSNHLIELVHRCLARDPIDRPAVET